MPNWCQNTLTVDCPDHSYLELFSRRAQGVDGAPLSLASLVPEPGDPDSPDYDWYSWRCENWGCKWDLVFDGPGIAIGSAEADPKNRESGIAVAEKTGRVSYNFITPYGPPVDGFLRASRGFPEARFTIRYAEAGMEFAGEVEIKNGQLLRDDELEVSDVLDPEDMWF